MSKAYPTRYLTTFDIWSDCSSLISWHAFSKNQTELVQQECPFPLVFSLVIFHPLISTLCLDYKPPLTPVGVGLQSDFSPLLYISIVGALLEWSALLFPTRVTNHFFFHNDIQKPVSGCQVCSWILHCQWIELGNIHLHTFTSMFITTSINVDRKPWVYINIFIFNPTPKESF